MSFVIDPTSVSFSQIKEDIELFLLSKPDADAWIDFFASGTGQTVVELIAGLASLLSYNIITGRREVYLPYAQNRSSHIASAQSMGYSVFRGRNSVIRLTVTPNVTQILPKFSTVGTAKDQDLILLEDIAVNDGVPIDVDVVVGTVSSEIQSITSVLPSTFRFTSNNISDDYRLFLNTTEVETSDRILELINDKFTVMTNVYNSVDIMYLNADTAPVQYITGDELKVYFVELKDLTFDTGDLDFLYGSIDTAIIQSNYQERETKPEVKINAPLFHETQSVIRGRQDYLKVFKFLDTSINDTDFQDVTTAVVELVYVLDSLLALTDAERQGFVDQLMSSRPMGLEPPLIKHPVHVPLTIDILLNLLDSTGDPVTDVEAIVSPSEKILKQEFDFGALEKSLEDLSYVETARVSISTEDWQEEHQYEKGGFVQPTVSNDRIYRANRILRFSGGSEPTWSTTLGDLVEDGDITWETIQVCEIPDTWASTTHYDRYDIVRPPVPNGYMYQVVGYKNYSGSSSEIQQVDFDAVPDAGTWRIHFGDEETTDLAFDADATAVQTAMNALTALSEVVVVGDYSAGFTITFAGADANQPQPQVAFIDLGIDEIQLVEFDLVPDAGSWSLEFDGQTTGPIAYNAEAADIKAALEALSNIDEVSVAGDYVDGISVTFLGINEKKDVDLMTYVDPANPGSDEIQDIDFDAVPDAGTWRMEYGSEETIDLPYDAPAISVQSALNALPSLSEVIVAGDYSAGFTITFQGADGDTDHPQLAFASAGVDEVQKIEFSAVPDSGTWRIHIGSEQTTDLVFNANAAAIEAAIEALASVTDVAVTGDYGSGFTVTFQNADGKQPWVQADVNDSGLNEVQTIDFSLVPDTGTFTLVFDGQETDPIYFNATRGTVKVELEELSNIDEVDVGGDYATGFVVTFKGVNEYQDVNQLTYNINTLSSGGGGVTITIDTDTDGQIPANSLIQGGSPIIMISSTTTEGKYPASNLTDGGSPVNITVITTAEGAAIVEEITSSGGAVAVDINETTQGKYPASNLTQGGGAVTITPSTILDAYDPEPTWPITESERVFDGEIIWQALTKVGTPDTWEPGVNYDVADYVIPLTVTAENEDLMYQCVGFVGKSSDSEPAWPATLDDVVVDGGIEWIAKDPDLGPDILNFDEFYTIEQNVSVQNA